MRTTSDGPGRLLVLVVALVLGLAACDRTSSEQGEEQLGSSQLLELRWAPGQLYAYSFEVETRVEIASTPTGSLKLKGVLELGALRDSPSGQEWLGIRLRQVQFTPVPGIDESKYHPLKAELEAAVGAARYEKGVLAGQLLHRAASPVAANLLRTLISQFQLAPGVPGSVYREVDATGAYEATYSVLASGEIRKSKQRYVAVNSAGYNRSSSGTNPVPVLSGAEATYRVDAGQLRSLRLSERVRSDMDGKSLLEASNDLRLVFLSAAPGSGATFSEIQGLSLSWPLDEARAEAAPEANLDAARVAALGFDAAVARHIELRRATNGGDFSSGPQGGALDDETRALRRKQLTEYQEVFDTIVAHLRLDVSSVEKAGVRLKKAPADEQGLLIDALGAAGSPPAQRLLLTLAVDDQQPLRLRGDAANRAARAEQPLPELEATLVVLSRHPSLAEYGLFALGTLSRRLREIRQNERADAVDDLLLQALEFANSDTERKRVLLGMSNAGSSRLLGAITRYLASDQEEVVVAAVAALRLIETREATALLIGALGDARRTVRRRVLEAMGARAPTPELVIAVSDFVEKGDGSDGRAAIRLLGDWTKEAEGASAALIHLSEKAPTPELQAAAREQHTASSAQ